MSRRRAAGAAVLLAAVLTTAGCGTATSEGDPVPSPHERPSMEAVTAELAEAEERIRAVVTEILPGARWERTSEPGTSPCTEDGDDVEGGRRLFPGVLGAAVVPDDQQWTAIRESVLPILADYGFDRVSMDSPAGDGAVFKVAGRYEGSSFSIQYEKRTAMSFRSGCHIPEGESED